ncbi:hypothetical protein HOF92_09710, partial [bacterium]|nr:hypothetical protein [bacterium]
AESLSIGRRDHEFPGWIWVETKDGNEGWAPEKILEIVGNLGVTSENYSARELDVDQGELLDVMRELNGWFLVQKQNGETGWISSSCLEVVGGYSEVDEES